MSNLAFERFWKEETIYFRRDGVFSPILEMIKRKLSDNLGIGHKLEIVETNELEFELDWPNQVICAEFLYGDPSKSKAVCHPTRYYHDRINSIVREIG